jgi:hypothetical protein
MEPCVCGCHSGSRRYIAGVVAEDAVVINSIIGDAVVVDVGATVCHSWLQAAWDIGAGAYVVGIHDDPASADVPRRVAPRIGVHEHRVTRGLTASPVGDGLAQSVWTLLGVDDNLSQHIDADRLDEPAGGFCNAPWAAFFERTKIDPAELWPPGTPRVTCHAKLFPIQAVGRRVSVDDVLWMQVGTPTAAQLARWRKSWRES